MTGCQLVRAPGGVRIEPLTEPGDDVPHVEMLAAGVCGTDIQIAARTRSDVATVLGHEGVGVLRNVAAREALVVFNPVDPRNPDAVLGHSFNGIFRSWVPLGPELPLGFLREVSSLVPVTLLALCEPLATVLYSWELIGSTSGPFAVGIWGAGPIGLLQATVAADAGHEVVLVHPRLSRLRWVRQQRVGAALRCVSAANRIGRSLDVAVLCVPRAAMAAAAREAADTLAPGGLMVLVAALDERGAAHTFVDPQVVRVRRRNQCGQIDTDRGTVAGLTREGKPLRVTGHRGSSLEQLGAAERRLRREPDRFASLITHRVSPEEAVASINARCAGRSRDDRGAEIVKLVIDFKADSG